MDKKDSKMYVSSRRKTAHWTIVIIKNICAKNREKFSQEIGKNSPK